MKKVTMVSLFSGLFVMALCLIMPMTAYSADKLIVQDASANTVFSVDDAGKFKFGPMTTASATKGYISTNTAESILIVEADGQNAGVFGRAYGAGRFPFFSGRSAQGTFASPSASLADSVIMRFGGAGYGTTGFAATNKASVDFKTAQNWSDTAQGTYMTFSTTAVNTTAMAERLRIDSTGRVGIGTTNPTSKLQVVGLSNYANNAAALAGGLTAGALYWGCNGDALCVVH